MALVGPVLPPPSFGCAPLPLLPNSFASPRGEEGEDKTTATVVVVAELPANGGVEGVVSALEPPSPLPLPLPPPPPRLPSRLPAFRFPSATPLSASDAERLASFGSFLATVAGSNPRLSRLPPLSLPPPLPRDAGEFERRRAPCPDRDPSALFGDDGKEEERDAGVAALIGFRGERWRRSSSLGGLSRYRRCCRGGGDRLRSLETEWAPGERETALTMR